MPRINLNWLISASIPRKGEAEVFAPAYGDGVLRTEPPSEAVYDIPGLSGSSDDTEVAAGDPRMVTILMGSSEEIDPDQ